MNRPTQFLKITIAVLSAVAAMAASSAYADDLPPGVVALVNGTRITQEQLDRA
ncbi:peptidyl-prolyl cis-trans isomerase, partial [Ralstonia pseudosolanacearum]|nr:peptidyl-prolyl cis-trans isomerase [Ralstonia pseudosolanacearum]